MKLSHSILGLIFACLVTMNSVAAQVDTDKDQGVTLEQAFSVNLKVAADAKIDASKIAEALKSLAHYSGHEMDSTKKTAPSLQVFFKQANPQTGAELQAKLVAKGFEVAKVSSPQIVEVVWVMTYSGGGG